MRPLGSNPAVGSSKTNTSGFMAITPAIATRRICPPDNSKGDRSNKVEAIPTAAKAASAFSRAVASSSPKFMGPNITSLRTVSSNSCPSGNWKTIPTRWRIFFKSFGLESADTTASPIRTWPTVGCTKALRCWVMVDFPDPVWPIIAVYDPSGIVTLISWRASLANGVPAP